MYREVRGKSNVTGFSLIFVTDNSFFFFLAYAIPGGSEGNLIYFKDNYSSNTYTFIVEIMLDLGVRQSMKIASFMGAKM